MQDTSCLRLSSKFNFGPVLPAALGKERGLHFLTSLATEMKSAEEGNRLYCVAYIVRSFDVAMFKSYFLTAVLACVMLTLTILKSSVAINEIMPIIIKLYTTIVATVWEGFFSYQ